MRRSYIETRPRKIFQRGKYRTNELAWVFVALIIQYAKLMLRILLSSVAYLTAPFFFTLSHKRHEFVKNIIAR